MAKEQQAKGASKTAGPPPQVSPTCRSAQTPANRPRAGACASPGPSNPPSSLAGSSAAPQLPGFAAKSVPEQARAVLQHFQRDEFVLPEWAIDTHSAISAANSCPARQRQLQEHVAAAFGAVTSLGMISLNLVQLHCRSLGDLQVREASGERPSLLRSLSSWLYHVLYTPDACAELPSARLPSSRPVLRAAVRRELVQWLVQRGYHQILPAMLLLPDAAKDQVLVTRWLLLLDGLPASEDPTDELSTRSSMRTDGFTVNALLCWMTRLLSQPPDGNAGELAFRVLNRLLHAREATCPPTLLPLPLLRWDVVSMWPRSGEEWLDFDADSGQVDVSVAYAEAAFRGYLLNGLLLDPRGPVPLNERLEVAKEVARGHAAASGLSAAPALAAGGRGPHLAADAQEALARQAAQFWLSLQREVELAESADSPAHGAGDSPPGAAASAGADGPPECAAADCAALTVASAGCKAGAGTAPGATARVSCAASSSPSSASTAAAATSSSSVALPADAAGRGKVELAGDGTSVGAVGRELAGEAAAEAADTAACAACGASRQDARLKACAGCRAVRYCSPACQKAHWRAHRQDCRRLPAAVL